MIRCDAIGGLISKQLGAIRARTLGKDIVWVRWVFRVQESECTW